MNRAITLATAGMAAILAAAISSLSTAHASSNVETRHFDIPKATIAQHFNNALSAMQVRLRNYGAKQGSGGSMSWHEDQSHVRMPGGQKWNLPIPEWVYSVPLTGDTRRWKIYVNNMITTSMQASIEGDRINLALQFGGYHYGPSVIGRCIRRIAKKWDECTATGEASLMNAKLGISLKPEARNGSISFATVSHQNDISFDYNLHIQHWLCGVQDGPVCNFLKSKIEDELTPMVKQTVAQRLTHSTVRDHVANAIMNIPEVRLAVNPDAGWEVVNVTDQGNSFRIHLERYFATDFGAAVYAGSTCPKPMSIVGSATTKVPVDVRMNYRIGQSGWSGWQKMSQVNAQYSNLHHMSLNETSEPIGPGTYQVEAKFRVWGDFFSTERTITRTVEVTCPLKEVSEVELRAFHPAGNFILVDSIPKLETACPVDIKFRGRFTKHDGAGDVTYRFRFSEGNRVSGEYATTIKHAMIDPQYKVPSVEHAFPFPLPALPKPNDDQPTGGIGGLAPQPTGPGVQIDGGMTAGDQPTGNEHKGSVRLEVITPKGSTVSNWVPYHIVCEPKTAFDPVGPLTAPANPEPPATSLPPVVTIPPAGTTPPATTGATTTDQSFARQRLVCTGGRVAGSGTRATCVCPRGQEPRQVGRNHYRCERSVARITCTGGTVRRGECFCPRTHRKVEAGRNAWRCVRATPQTGTSVTPGGASRPVICQGGQVRRGQCVCPRGTQRAPMAAANAWRCTSAAPPRGSSSIRPDRRTR